jgi:3-hydroxyisobutyrate dehydrogenase
MFRDTAAPAPADDPWYDVLTHTRDLAEKDLRFVLELGREVGVDLPFAEQALRLVAASLGVPHE